MAHTSFTREKFDELTEKYTTLQNSKDYWKLEISEQVKDIFSQIVKCSTYLFKKTKDEDAICWTCEKIMFNEYDAEFDLSNILDILKALSKKRNGRASDILAQYYGGMSRLTSIEEVDHKKAWQYLEKAEEEGYTWASARMLFWRLDDPFTAKFKKRLKTIKAAHPVSFAYLSGFLALKNLQTNEGFIDYKNALKFFEMAISYTGNIRDDEKSSRDEAEFQVGRLYYEGRGTPKDKEKGLTHIQKAYDLGHHSAYVWLKRNKLLPSVNLSEIYQQDQALLDDIKALEDQLDDNKDVKPLSGGLSSEENKKLSSNYFVKLERPLTFGKPDEKIKSAVATKADVPLVDPEKMLEIFFGIKPLKQKVKDLKQWSAISHIRQQAGLPFEKPDMNMIFMGLPGTGKTTAARKFGEIYKGLGLLPTSKVVEVDRSDLVGEYIGQTAQHTLSRLNAAKGGILFIDEAYQITMSDSPRDFGSECIATMVKFMEDHYGQIAIIAAGYEDQMKIFLSSNPGLASRFSDVIHFPSFSVQEMLDIFKQKLSEHGYFLADEAVLDVRQMIITQHREGKTQNGNGRFIRGLVKKVILSQSRRILSEGITAGDALSAILPEDLNNFKNIIVKFPS